MNCIICNSSTDRFLFIKNNVRYVKCANCGLVFQNPQPNQETIESQYDDFSGYWKEYEDKLDADISTKSFYLTLLKKHININMTMKVLDFGSGPGTFLSIIRPFVSFVRGIELSKWAAEYGKKKYQINISNGDLFDVDLEDERFNLITMWHVIEHLPNPVEYIEKLKKSLVPGGYIAIATPNVNSIYSKILSKHWTYFIPNEHIFLFSKTTLLKLLREQGFKIISTQNYLYKKVGALTCFKDFVMLFSIRLVKKSLSKLPIKNNYGPFRFNNWKMDKKQTALPGNSNKDGIIVFAQLMN